MGLLGVAPPGDTVAPQMVVAPPVAMMGMTAPPILPCMVGKPPAEVAAMHAVMMEFGRQLQAPLSAAHLEGVAEEARDAMLGERVYALVYPLAPEEAGKVTGMLLELQDTEVLDLLTPTDMGSGVQAVAEVVAEARAVLAEYEMQEAAAAVAAAVAAVVERATVAAAVACP